jgi:hypothetical protein
LAAKNIDAAIASSSTCAMAIRAASSPAGGAAATTACAAVRAVVSNAPPSIANTVAAAAGSGGVVHVASYMRSTALALSSVIPGKRNNASWIGPRNSSAVLSVENSERVCANAD